MNKLEEVITSNFSGARKKKQDISSSEDACDVRLNDLTTTRPLRPRTARTIQNFLLVWLDRSINEVHDNDCRNIITELRQVVNTVATFTDADECIDFITDVNEEEIVLILSETFIQTIVPVVDEIRQVSSIYIFPGNKTQHDKWVEPWPKMKGVFTDITSICEALKRATQDCDQNSVSISFVKPTVIENLDELDPSFMYTQILKEILLTIDFQQEHFNDFLTYCREELAGNTAQLENVDKLEREYHQHRAIWWYTYDSFLYSMLNRALRLMEFDRIITLGFFVRDLHNHIVALHAEQYGGHHYSDSFIVYRGQGLPNTDFNQLKQPQGGLLSFNYFLSTSLDRAVSFAFAEANQDNPDLVGVLFQITIDPSVSSSTFANVENISYYREGEVLFSMNSVFHIGQLEQIDNNDRLWQIDLTLTSYTDPLFRGLIECVRRESFPHQKGWYRLGSLLINVGQFQKAQEVFEIILDQTSDESEKANIYHMLGIVKYNHGEYAEAITFYEKSVEIMQKFFSSTHLDLAASYRNMGTVYDKMGDYSKALLFHGKALEIYQNTVPSNHLTFSVSGDNNNLMNETMDDCSKAILSFEKALKILEKTLPVDDPSLATFYDRYGSVYEKMGDNSKALLLYERALKIKEKHLPFNHPSLAASYANIAIANEKMGDSSTARSFRQRALAIGQRSLPANHPDLQVYRQNVENEIQEP